MENLGINLGYLLVQIFMFGIVFVTLRVWIYKPMLGMLEKRRQTIAKGVEDARVAAAARDNAEKEAAGIVSEAQVKAAAVAREATDRADAIGKEKRAALEVELAKLRENAKTEVQQERVKMLQELRGQVAALAIAAAQKLIGESLLQNKAQQQALVQEFFSGIKSGKVVVLQGASAEGETAEVTSALSLSDEEQVTIKKDLVAMLGKKADVTFQVDPAILGGLVVRVGDRVIDGSVSGQLQGLRHNLL